jgi:hypothetical protein
MPDRSEAAERGLKKLGEAGMVFSVRVPNEEALAVARYVAELESELLARNGPVEGPLVTPDEARAELAGTPMAEPKRRGRPPKN